MYLPSCGVMIDNKCINEIYHYAFLPKVSIISNLPRFPDLCGFNTVYLLPEKLEWKIKNQYSTNTVAGTVPDSNRLPLKQLNKLKLQQKYFLIYKIIKNDYATRNTFSEN